jgi:hypothetical protein
MANDEEDDLIEEYSKLGLKIITIKTEYLV